MQTFGHSWRAACFNVACCTHVLAGTLDFDELTVPAADSTLYTAAHHMLLLLHPTHPF